MTVKEPHIASAWPPMWRIWAHFLQFTITFSHTVLLPHRKTIPEQLLWRRDIVRNDNQPIAIVHSKDSLHHITQMWQAHLHIHRGKLQHRLTLGFQTMEDEQQKSPCQYTACCPEYHDFDSCSCIWINVMQGNIHWQNKVHFAEVTDISLWNTRCAAITIMSMC